jgi:hypothetical protein
VGRDLANHTGSMPDPGPDLARDVEQQVTAEGHIENLHATADR